jgi:hypothetical protein
MEKQQTAVDWLIEQMKQRESQGLTLSMYELEMFAEQANKMFEEQVMDAYIEASANLEDIIKEEAENYYKKTFKSQ